MKHLLLAVTAGGLFFSGSSLFFLTFLIAVPTLAQPPLPIIGYLKGDNQNDRLGTTLAGPGDINGDSFADLLAAELGTKRVKLFYGNAGRIDSIPDMVWNGYISVRTIGDINGDGKPEVVMGTDSAHQLRIFWGGNLLDTIPDFVFDFSDTTCVGGKGIQDVSAGDLNGDGCGDLVVSTIFNCSAPILELGRVLIFWGGSLLDTFPDWNRTLAFQPSPYRRRFGASVKVLPNLNGDTFADLVVSQMGNTPAGTTGCLHIFLGGNQMDTLEDQIVGAPPPAGDSFSLESWGSRIIPMNDLNNDGRTDFWVGGATLLRFYYGAFPVDTVPVAVLDQGGEQPTPGGDYNQDGFTDFILGQPRASFLAGSVFIYLGSSNMNGVYDIAIHDFQLPTVAQVFGLAVTNTGDMDGDGIDDFAASAKVDTDPFDRGEVFIFSGDSSIPTGIKDDETNLPRFFELFQNAPNPFPQMTEIGFNLKSMARLEKVKLEVYNLVGQRIRTLIDERGKAGERRVDWNGRDEQGKLMPSGIYFYKLSYGNETQVKKMLLIR